MTPVRSGLLYGVELMVGISLLYLLNVMLELPCQRDHPHVILEAHLSCKTAKDTASCPHIHHHLSLKVCNILHDATLVGTSSCAVLVKAAATGNMDSCLNTSQAPRLGSTFHSTVQGALTDKFQKMYSSNIHNESMQS